MLTANRPDRRIGKIALDLPVLGLGAAHLGELYSPVPEARSQATPNAAWDAGVRDYDTAPWYGRGLSEHRLGAFLRTKSRAAFKVTTKVGRTLYRPKDVANFDRSPWLGGLNFDVHFDYSYDGIGAVCRAHGVPLPAAALQFLLAHPAVTWVIPEGVTQDEVMQNLASPAAAIPAIFWTDLKRQGLIDAAAPVPA